VLPDADRLADVLIDLGVPHQDIDESVRLSRRVRGDKEALRILEGAVADLVEGIGEIRGIVDVPALAGAPQPLARFFPLYVFVAALPHVRAHHRERGVPQEVGRRTLVDVGRCVAWHRRWHGTGGVLSPRWLTLHFHGELYQLGRLQFQRGRIGRRTSDFAAAAGLALEPADLALRIHVPDFMGPLSPEAVDRSLALAREFFARHYPEERHAVATCDSWLLDPQLKRYLPEDSNIVRFQQRFRAGRPPAEPEDTEPVRFVFGTTDIPLDRLPRDTVVQRTVVDHLRRGGHWYVGHGWFAL
jgi:hypothetical protein